MTRKFICIQGSPEIPKGTVVRQDDGYNLLNMYVGNERIGSLCMAQVEENECWQEVEEEIKEEEKLIRFKPKMGQPFYCIDESGFIEEDEWDGTLGDQRKWDIGNCFQSEQEARDEVKRRESIANAWRPMEGEWCWIWDFTRGGAGNICYNTNFLLELYIGAIHPTEEACLDWGETDAHLFLPETV